MKERIREIAGGKIKYDVPVPALDPERITAAVPVGGTAGGEVVIGSRNRVPVRGFVYSDNRQVTPVSPTFSGGRCRVGYRVRADRMHPGEEISGNLTLVTNAGELTVPYTFTVEAAPGDAGEVKSVEALMALYEEDPGKAAEVFVSARFVQAPFMKDAHCLALYETLLRGRQPAAAVREFLRGMGYDIPEEETPAAGGQKNEWRTTPLYDAMTDIHGYESYARFLMLVLEYRSGKRQAAKLLPEMEQEAIRLGRSDPSASLPVLFRAWLAVQGGYRTAAEKMLESVYHTVIDHRRTEIFEYCFYLYLRTCGAIADDQRANIIRLIDRYFADMGQPLELLPFVLYADPDRYREGGAAISLLRSAFERGLRSPFLYQEAMGRFNAEPELFDRLDDFAWECLRFSLYFCGDAEGSGRENARDAMVSEGLAEKAAQLVGTSRRYSRPHVEAMQLLYRRYPTDGLLRAVLAYMMAGGERGPEALPWYEEGVRRSLDMMGLYEAYLGSCPAEGDVVFPREMLLYYGYRNELPADLRGVLYAYVLKNRAADPDTFALYRDQMEEFAVSELLQGKMSPYLAPIYEHIVCREMIDARLARVLPDLLMAKQITCPREGMTQVFVRYPELQQELAFPTDGKKSVCCPVYTDDALLLFGDAAGVRYVFPDTEVRPLMNRRELLDSCRELAGDRTLLKLLTLREVLAQEKAGEENWSLLSDASHDTVFHPEFRKKIGMYLLEHWSVFGGTAEAKDYLNSLDDEEMPPEMRTLYLELLIKEQLYERAMQSAAAFGFRGAAREALLSLVTDRIREGAAGKNPDMLQLCQDLSAAGMDNKEVCAYLCQYANGATASGLRILRRSIKCGTDLADLPERLLAQMLFTGNTADCDEVFSVYAASEKVYHTLAQAYFVWRCYEHLVKGSPVPSWFFNYVRQYREAAAFTGGGEVLTALALLEEDLRRKRPSAKIQAEIRSLAEGLAAAGQFFACFDRLPEGTVLPERLNGCRIAEYRTEEPGKYWVNCQHPGEAAGTLLPLARMCEGIYTCPLTLFSDEDAQMTVMREDRIGLSKADGTCRLSAGSIRTMPGSLFESLDEAGTLLAAGGKDNADAAEDVLRRAAFCEEMLGIWMGKIAELKGEPR